MSYGPDHIYTRIGNVHGVDPALIERAAIIAKDDGICIQTYAEPVRAAAMLATMGYIARATNELAKEATA